MVNLDKFKCRSLFLLVGINPLPNYVAAKLLLEDNGHLYLVHTSETDEVADRLIAALCLSSDKIIKIPIKEANHLDISNQVRRYIQIPHDDGECQKIGLNYTGGTKTMAVHAYRAVEKHCPGAVFSYLDARSLHMIFERQGQYTSSGNVVFNVKPDIQTLLSLHGYTLKHDPIQEVLQPKICQALARIGVQWRAWCDQNLRSGANTSFRKEKELKTVILPCVDGIDWQGCNTLGDLAIQWEIKVGKLVEWLDGKWLEHYTLSALQQIASQCQVHQTGMNIEPKERKFEFDVVAMRGYQLFAISCSTETRKGVLKHKLFEAYVRARQMGGDEARVGLVCCAPKNNPDSSPAAIQREIEESWDAAGKVRVFGAEHLPDLPSYLQDWFNSQPM